MAFDNMSTCKWRENANRIANNDTDRAKLSTGFLLYQASVTRAARCRYEAKSVLME